MAVFDLITIILTLMVCLAASVIWTFWRFLQRESLPTIEENRQLMLGIGLGLSLGIFIGIALGRIILDDVLLGISLGAGGGLSLGLGIVNIPLIRRED